MNNDKTIQRLEYIEKPGKGNHGQQLTKEELKQLKQLVKKSATRVDLAREIKIDRNVLDRVLSTGRGRKETVEYIRTFFNSYYENQSN